jgi:formylglycine-generating enzyme required for sulfatase activity
MSGRIANARWRLKAIAIVLAAWSAIPLAAADEPKKVALLVGINKYDRRKLESSPLQFAERDIQELAAVLKQHDFEVRTLTGPAATKAHIDDALAALLKGRRKDVVLVGFAGHGTQMNLLDDQGKPLHDEQGQALSDAFFCPFDAVVGKGSTMISLTRLIERLDNEGGTNLFLVDACREETEVVRGLGKRSLSGDELIGRLPANSAILFSCSKGQQALEHASAGGGHGVFFHHVIEGLRGAAADPDTGEVGWDDLVGYVRKRVNRTARALDPKGADTADERFDGRLQTPHELRNLVATPVLARRAGPRGPNMAEPAGAPGRAVPHSDTITSKASGIQLKLIPAGQFLMGSAPGDKDAFDDEKPWHWVRITQPFYLGVTEVTRGQFRRFVDDAGYQTEAEKDGKGGSGWNEETKKFEQNPRFNWQSPGFEQTDDHPVVNVSWNDAQAFIAWLNRKDGQGKVYRLPTEAEWEYACRAGTKTRYFCGDDPEGLAAFENIADGTAKEKYSFLTTIAARDGYVYTAPVGRFQPNAYGLFDMHGNVCEWCSDGYAADYYKQSPLEDPAGVLGAWARVFRGGGWSVGPRYDRSANRHGCEPGSRDIFLGFRLALV